jgi:DNA-binding transcriptional LysR family regulator
MIRAIERRVGYELFQQDRMLIPTSRGARFLHEAQRAVGHLDATPA